MQKNDRGNVLVVDDHPVNRMVIRKMLESYPVTIDEAADGMTAAQMTVKKKYALIFMDCLMPGWDGVQTAREIRALAGEKNVPYIVAVSGEYTEERKKQLYEAGVKLLLLKPLRDEQLRRCLADAGVDLTEYKEWQIKDNLRQDATDVPQELTAKRLKSIGTGDSVMDKIRQNQALQRAIFRALAEQTEQMKQSLEKESAPEWEVQAEHACHTLKGLMATVEEKELSVSLNKLLTYIRNHEREQYLINAEQVYVQVAERLAGWRQDMQAAAERLAEKEEQLVEATGDTGKKQILEKKKDALLTAIRIFDYDGILALYDEMYVQTSGELRQGLRKARELAEQFQYAKSQEYFLRLFEE